MLNSILDSSGITFKSLMICSLVSLVIGCIIGIIHTKTSNNSKNFAITLTVLPLLVQVTMMLVNGNLGTGVAILGAFSLVRFRSIPGTSKEIISIFFAMAMGLATGTGYIGFALIMSIIISIILIVLNYTKVYTNSNKKILKLIVPEDLDYINAFKDIFDKYGVTVDLQKIKTVNLGSLFELTYSINLGKKVNIKELIDDLRVKNGNLKIMLSDMDSSNEML